MTTTIRYKQFTKIVKSKWLCGFSALFFCFLIAGTFFHARSVESQKAAIANQQFELKENIIKLGICFKSIDSLRCEQLLAESYQQMAIAPFERKKEAIAWSAAFLYRNGTNPETIRTAYFLGLVNELDDFLPPGKHDQQFKNRLFEVYKKNT